jgi:hypothetical protein
MFAKISMTGKEEAAATEEMRKMTPIEFSERYNTGKTEYWLANFCSDKQLDFGIFIIRKHAIEDLWDFTIPETNGGDDMSLEQLKGVADALKNFIDFMENGKVEFPNKKLAQ